ncbi:hypothetical protein PRIPAC_70498 [Pristionchus pacificus]|uniref:Uncharacterized protein n=1 Tax=Pristionchus pacificus TaxID=54126 RepID=A0A2A6B4C1_PRIPA|nr:hypothetical protein PRIPAC_70498 [Pristionchus pacificus]|eukprot:PDM60714.1 hypothetical protein PRIPAC_54520 [Pristionchus pacificus]
MPFPSFLPRPLFFLLFLAIPLLAQMPLRHTFDTREMCNSRCNGQCGSENSSDHPGLPRWEDDDPYYQDEEGTSFPSLAILVPLIILGTLVLFFVCVSCTQRFLR